MRTEGMKTGTYATVIGFNHKGIWQARAADGRLLNLAASQTNPRLRTGYGVMCEDIWTTGPSWVASSYRVVDTARRSADEVRAWHR